jgi:uncharacterized protein YicC (UPF0701 family)
MTGFGAAEGQVGTARVAVEVRSVNHRFFSASLKLPASLSPRARTKRMRRREA